MLTNSDKFARPSQPPPQVEMSNVYSVPTEYIEIPSQGKFYPESHPLYKVNKVEIKLMTTKEEDILVNPSYLEEGVTFEKLLKSIIVDKRVRTESLLAGDRNALLVGARQGAFGDDYPVDITCENCSENIEHVVDLGEIKFAENKYDGADFTEKGTFIIELPQSKVFVEAKILTGEDESSIQRKIEQKLKHKLPTETLIERYRHIFTSVNGDDSIYAINNFINSMPIADSVYFKTKYAKIVPDIDFIYDCVCPKCNHHNKGGVPILANFFWPDPGIF